MKKFLVLLLLCGFIAAADATVSTGTLVGGVRVETLKYLPYPAEPGQYIELWLNVVGTASTAENIACKISPDFPFSLDANEVPERNLTGLQKGQSAAMKYKVRVASSAVVGNNAIEFSCRTSDTGWVDGNATIYVQAQDAILAIEQVEVTPKEVEPGSSFGVTMTLKNAASVFLKDITLKLDISGTTLPFAPVNGTTEKTVRSLEAGQAITQQFSFVVSQEAEGKPYKIPVQLTYYDELGKEYEKSDYVGVVVGSKAELIAKLDSTDIFTGNSSGKATVKLVNAGLGKIKFLRVILQDSPDYDIISPSSAYVGSLPSDEYETIEYELYVKRNAPATVTLPLRLEYRNSNNEAHTEYREVEFRIYSLEDAYRLGIKPRPETNWLLIGIAALVILYLLYRFVYKRFAKKLV